MTNHHHAPISVVVPMRDASAWLPCLLAALTREWEVGFELIAIDDASSDDSAGCIERLCSHWPTQRWQLLDGGGKGVSAARNLGVAASRSDLIAFLDADDCPLPGRLSLPIQALSARSDLSHIHGGWWRGDRAGHCQHLVEPWLEGARFDWRGFMEHKAVLPSAWTVRREAFEAVGGFDVSLQQSEDVDLLLRMAALDHQGGWINAAVVMYRIHDRNTSKKLTQQINGLLTVMERHLIRFPQNDSAWIAKQRYDTTLWTSWLAWQSSAPSLALTLLRQALPSCPYPLARRCVHYLEVFQRSCARIGISLNRDALLASDFWQHARQLLEQR
jgi:glycosyltransferase involved in cell wall biosynthesis